VERDDAVLIFDDTVQEKPYTDENEVMCWHYDHSKGRTVQGFNLLNCLYQVGEISIPVAFELIRKPLEYCFVLFCSTSGFHPRKTWVTSRKRSKKTSFVR
jgi:hypothetical protein